MTPTELLDQLRKRRGFDAATYLDAKIEALRNFFIDNELDSVVIGVSGGIDSAVALALLAKLHKPGGVLRKIVPLLMPIYGNGVTGQKMATLLATKQCEMLDLDPVTVDLTAAYNAYVAAGSDTIGEKSAWANGQLASIVRTPCTYYHAALLQTKGHSSIVVGTINRDEGAYIGFWGKASDAMVDLQPIADLHKSEVYALADLLDICPAIKQRDPKGDVWDSKTDREMIGAPYWAVEMHSLLGDYGPGPKGGHDFSRRPGSFSIDHLSLGRDVVLIYFRAIEKLHRVNSHKYIVGMPSHFVDVMPRRVRNGW